MGISELDQLCINTIRFLAVDAVQKANSGHPGLPMGAAPMAYVLWTRHLRHNPADPAWPDRDRFVLSAGHGSMLLYALLHLTGYDLPMSELQRFRQLGSRTPGHPEAHVAPGVEATTGPLGQGLGNAVGMAIAEAHLAARYNRPGHTVVDHRTWCLASDGDLMEGVGAESCSLAGHLGLHKLTVLYDCNGISLAGATDLAFTENVAERFRAYGWRVLTVGDGNDLAALDQAMTEAQAEKRKPTLIIVPTVLGYGAPHKQGTFAAHGSPLGPDEVRAAKLNLGWPLEPAFLVPEAARERFTEAQPGRQRAQDDWQAAMDGYNSAFPEEAAELRRRLDGQLPEGWEAGLPAFGDANAGMSTRKASEAALQALGARLPELVGGAADLNPSTFTWLKGQGDFQDPKGEAPDHQGAVGVAWGYEGRNLHFGVREHAMGAVCNGMALHGGVLPFAGTFLIFSDYMRPAIRLAAMSRLRVIYVFTHDSIGLGEDGPTHQPVEQLMSLRQIPNMTVIRPADAGETVEAWRAAIANASGPTALILTRQNVAPLDREHCETPAGLRRGGYVLWEPAHGKPELILIGTGSETALALAAGRALAAEGVHTRVVSLPSWEMFGRQPLQYREYVLPPAVRARVAVEAGNPLGWEHFVGLDGQAVGIATFGASAPGDVLFRHFDITVEHLTAAARDVLSRTLQETREAT